MSLNTTLPFTYPRSLRITSQRSLSGTLRLPHRGKGQAGYLMMSEVSKLKKSGRSERKTSVGTNIDLKFNLKLNSSSIDNSTL